MSYIKVLSGVEPTAVWQAFEALSQIPRGSGKEERAVAFILDFGASLNLKTIADKTGNVVICKLATSGMEDCPTVALQCHLDMVQQQEPGRGFNFDVDPIELILDGDWVRAHGTTLGADNGLGVALAMAVLSAKDLAHPKIEALFTVDEEVGMSGAEAVTSDQLSAAFLINLDMESDHELTIGCAGAVDIVADGPYQTSPLSNDVDVYTLELTGGLGGHSGLDIHLGHMNAIQTLARALQRLSDRLPISLISFDGPGVANVIPRRAIAQFSIATSDQDTLVTVVGELSDLLLAYVIKEPKVHFTCTRSKSKSQAFATEDQTAFLNAITAVKNGVYSMSTDVDDLVETSNNLSVVKAVDGRMSIICLARTCIEDHKPTVVKQVTDSFLATSVTITTENDSPGWEPRADSLLLKLMSAAYVDVIGQWPGVIAIHAGLETGILSSTFPNTEMVSYGPNILGAHSPDERVQISSVQKAWSILQKTLSSIPAQKDILQ